MTANTKAFAAWTAVGRASGAWWLGALAVGDPRAQLSAWNVLGGALGEACVASTHAVTEFFVDIARDFAERVAAAPRSSMMAVEGAHQAYDLAVAFSEANAAFGDAGLAALRSVDFVRAAVRDGG